MNLQGSLSILILAAGILVSSGLLLRLWRDRAKPAALWLFVSVLCSLIWSLGYMLEIIPTELQAKVFWAKFQFIGISFITLGIFGFGLHYTRRGRWLTGQRIGLLCVIPVLTIIAVYTNEIHGGIWSRIELQGGGGYLPLNLTHGGWFWVTTAYSYILLIVVTAFLFQTAASQQNLFRMQGRTMLAGILIPWISNVFYVFDISPIPNLDLTPIAFTITNLAFAIGLYRFRLLDMLPLAHETVLDAMSEAILILDSENRVVDSNAAARRIFGRNSQEIFGLPCEVLLPAWQTLPLGKAGREMTLELNGEPRMFRLRAYPISDLNEANSGQILLLADISEYRTAEKQVVLQLAALESVQNAIVITDHDGNIEWANPAFTAMTGYALQEVLGKNPRFLKSDKQDGKFYRELWETIQAGQVWRGDLYNRRKDGTNYYEAMTITPLIEPGGRVTHYIAVKEDVTQRKLYEEQLLETSSLKTQLLANVSHDMRTPLGVIIGYAEMLLDGRFGKIRPQQGKVLAEIVSNSDRLLVFIENLIGQAQIESGRLVLLENQFGPAQIVEAVRDFGGILAQSKGISLEYQIDPGLPQMLSGDFYWLKQIVLNLISNSIKFTDEGSVRLRLYSPTEDHWAIEVADSGAGIKTEDQERIFEPFQRAEQAAADGRAGSGLGLAIVRDLTSLMNGEIEMESAVGKGTTMRVILPIVATEAAT